MSAAEDYEALRSNKREYVQPAPQRRKVIKTYCLECGTMIDYVPDKPPCCRGCWARINKK